jgi:hypothetical protein
MCLRRAPEKYIAGAALDRAGPDNMGSSTSHNPIGFHGLLQEIALLFLHCIHCICVIYRLCAAFCLSVSDSICVLYLLVVLPPGKPLFTVQINYSYIFSRNMFLLPKPISVPK